MSEVDQLRTARYISVIGTAKTVTQAVSWPVLGIALALICVLAWDLVLLWLAVQLCRIVLF